MSQQDLDAVREETAALPFDAVLEPATPPDVLAHEATQLLKLLERQENSEALLRVGMTRERLAKLPRYIGALDAAQDQWLLLFGRGKSPERIQKEQEAVSVRRELIAIARWVLRGDAFARATLDFIEQGDGMVDTVEDLRALAALVRDRAPSFARLKDVDALALADHGAALAMELRDTLTSSDRSDVRVAAKSQRDRAYTLLADLVSELYDAGRFAFRHDPPKAALFRSAYQHRSSRRKRTGVNAEPPAAAEVGSPAMGGVPAPGKAIPGPGIVV